MNSENERNDEALLREAEQALRASLVLWEGDARLWPTADKTIKPLLERIAARSSAPGQSSTDAVKASDVEGYAMLERIRQFQFCIEQIAYALGACCGGVDSSPEDQLSDPHSTTRVLVEAIMQLKNTVRVSTLQVLSEDLMRLAKYLNVQSVGCSCAQSVERFAKQLIKGPI